MHSDNARYSASCSLGLTAGLAGLAEVPGGTLSFRLPTDLGVALSWHAVSPGTAQGEARKGFARLEVAVPSSPDIPGEARRNG